MMFSESFFRLSALLGFVIVLLVVLFGYLFFEPYITEETVTVKVLNKAQFGNETGKYFVFTQDEVFYNSDNYYHNKENADELNEKIYPGSTYTFEVVGVSVPWLPRFRNITKIIRINGVLEE
jgi:4-amino-4-deoxy-L-arabinose transferase-like glycosyltransferase